MIKREEIEKEKKEKSLEIIFATQSFIYLRRGCTFKSKN